MMENEKETKQETLFKDIGEEIKEEQALQPVKRAEVVELERQQLEALTPEKAKQLLTKRNETLEFMRKATILCTYAEDWVIHKDPNTGNEFGYCQKVGGERICKLLAIDIYDIKELPREDFPPMMDADGKEKLGSTFTYTVKAKGRCGFTGEDLKEVIGSRWSGSKFFQRQDIPDPSNVKKAARANLDGRIIRSLAGLSRVPIDELKAAGLNPDKMTRIEYKSAEKGTAMASGAQLATIYDVACDKVIGFTKEIAKDATLPVKLTKPQASEMIQRLIKIIGEIEPPKYLEMLKEVQAKVKGWKDVEQKEKKNA